MGIWEDLKNDNVLMHLYATQSAYDFSPVKNDGIVVDGIFSNKAYLPGITGIDCGTDPTLSNRLNDFSQTVVFRVNSIVNETLVTSGGGSLFRVSASKLRLTKQGVFGFDSVSSIETGIEYKATVTVSSTEGCKIYINGVLDSTHPNTSDLNPITYYRIGSGCNGEIKAVTVHNAVLDSTQVASLHDELDSITKFMPGYIPEYGIINELADNTLLLHNYAEGHAFDLSNGGNDGVIDPVVFFTNRGLRCNSSGFYGVTVPFKPQHQITTGSIVIGPHRIFNNSTSYFFNNGFTGYFFYYSNGGFIGFYTSLTLSALAFDPKNEDLYFGVNFTDGLFPEFYVNGEFIGYGNTVLNMGLSTSDINIKRNLVGKEDSVMFSALFDRPLSVTEHRRLFHYFKSNEFKPKSHLCLPANRQDIDDGDMQHPDTSFWTPNSGAVLSKEVENGRRYLQVYCNAGDSAAQALQTKLIPGHTYTVEVKYKTGGHGIAYTYIGATNQHALGNETDWTIKRVVSNATDANFLVGVFNSPNTNPTEAYFDYVKVYDSAKEYSSPLFKTTFGINQSSVSRTVDNIENSYFKVGAGSVKVLTDRIDGGICKIINCEAASYFSISSQDMRQTLTEAAFGEWEFWFYKNQSSENVRMFFISDTDNTSPTAYYVLQFFSDNKIYLSPGLGNTSSTFPIQTWHHARIKRAANGDFEVYINGNLEITANSLSVMQSRHMVMSGFTDNAFIYASRNGDKSFVKKVI